MGGASELQQILSMLCFNTEWKYAVFWKLKYRARMELTCEDAYCDMNRRNGDPAENNCLRKTLKKLHDGSYGHDPLGLAVAKMSYHVHSLGEGVVGQVAACGKHQWIYAENLEMTTCSSFKYPDGWQDQFSAGIRTIAVVAVPHGVVQLGSVNKVVENMDLVTHIRNVFMALPNSPVEHDPRAIQNNLHSSLHLQGITSKGFASEVPEYLHHLPHTLNSEEADIWFSVFPILGRDNDGSFNLTLPSNNEGMTVEVVNNHGELELPSRRVDEKVKLLRSKSNTADRANHGMLGMCLIEKNKYGRKINNCKGSTIGSGSYVNLSPHESVMEGNNSCSVVPFCPSDLIDSAICDRVRVNSLDSYQNEVLHSSESSDIMFQKNMENTELQGVSSHMDASSASSKFPAGYELHEALGPAFLKKSKCFDWEPLKTEVSIPEQVRSNQLTSESHPEHLLEAVIANVCQNSSDAKYEKSFCKSVQSLLTAENYPEPSSCSTLIADPSNHSSGPRGHLAEETQHCLSSLGVTGVMSPRGFLSCPSTSNEQFERSSAPTKNNKKRARPGENCRPRPRDRQLIQDRIKELRDLIPSGGKCSIDSLLERTIKHMLYLQSITKHADKLNKYSDMKNVHLCQKEPKTTESSTYERGSSWAVEVGGNLKVCSIVVENLNKSGQMVVEMMCEECSHFLEIAEAIKSLGLTILKGVTKAHSEKTWICFVVEAQSNRSLHRMDILWSLVQILQPKNSVVQQ